MFLEVSRGEHWIHHRWRFGSSSPLGVAEDERERTLLRLKIKIKYILTVGVSKGVHLKTPTRKSDVRLQKLPLRLGVSQGASFFLFFM